MTDLSEKTILVAEDDPINMIIAVKILEQKKARIVNISFINGELPCVTIKSAKYCKRK